MALYILGCFLGTLDSPGQHLGDRRGCAVPDAWCCCISVRQGRDPVIVANGHEFCLSWHLPSISGGTLEFIRQVMEQLFVMVRHS